MELDSLLLRVDTSAHAERLTAAGGDVLDWRGVVPSATGGEVTWREVLIRVPAAVALRLGLITLGEGLHGTTDAAARLDSLVVTTNGDKADIGMSTTRTGTPLVAPRRHRSQRLRGTASRDGGPVSREAVRTR
jgi:hypothetical protein